MKDSTKKIAVGAFFVAAAGYVAGILTAPKSGKETRQDIKDAAVKARTEADKTLKKLNAELGELIEKGKIKAQNLNESAKKQLANLLSQAQFAKEKVRVLISAVHEGDADDKDLQKAIDEAKKAADHLKTFLAKQDAEEKAK